MLKLKNTATKKLEEFHPIDKNNVKIYTCGPTVYGYQHIGNYACFIYWDLLVRTLKKNGFPIRRIMNITDVGHLVSDEDAGEDKMEKGARREGKTVWEVARFYTDDFLKHFRALNMLEPEKFCRATNYIEADKQLVETMIKRGYTYETSDGIYFDTSKFPDYAQFANLDLEGLKAGARVDYSSEKRNPSDFAIWKFIKEGEKHDMRWGFLDRPGYPGWHLECSTIIHEELGEPIDIHTGGIDHVPVHHTNEIAQTFASTNKKLANYWLHCNHITINDEKISKSLGNTYTFDDLEKRGFSHMDFKMWVLSGTYSGTRNFTFEDLASAKTRRLNWRNKIALSRQLSSPHETSALASSDKKTPKTAIPPRDDNPSALSDSDQKILNSILDAVNNNLNSAAAFALIDQITEPLPILAWQYIDELFGLNLLEDSPDISERQKSLLAERQKAREIKDYKKSDDIRKTLEDSNITIKDTKDGQIWQYLA